MSLVGPRTILKENSSDYGDLPPSVISVRPGITGPWIFLETGELEKEVLHTTFYILNWSFWEDIVILIRTVILGFRYMFRTGYDDNHNESD
jgi:lipopolysaccharide/colanic/teichoic acid biosynthesis glycosyltransferase